MKSIVITEKPSQARNVQAAVKSAYGQIFPASGHVIRIKQPGEQNPNWLKWTYDLLMPPGGVYDFVPDDASGYKKKVLNDILSALKTADTVYIATDCDREGQLIGEEILAYAKFRGKIMRVMFTAEDPVTLQKAFQQAKPNSAYANLYGAGFARLQGDQIYNLTLTRVATKALGDPSVRKAIGIGRVKTPTLGIVCAREMEIANFKPEDFFDILATMRTRDKNAAAVDVVLQTSRPNEKRITSEADAKAIEAAAQAFVGPLEVETNRQNVKPPRPFDLPSLQVAAGEFKISPKKTAEIAQALYETHKITTYPRAESRYLPEALMGDAKRVFGDVARLPFLAGQITAPPLTRVGKDYTFSDKGLNGASHHAIIPNPNCPSGIGTVYGRLSPDEKVIFELIARQFAAALMDDLIQDVTSITANVPVGQAVEPFKATGASIIYAGWRAVLPKNKADQILPAIKDGEQAKTIKTELQKKATKPPARYSEPALIKAMQEAYKFVKDPDEAERLKEAKGIGTPATRDSIIEDLKKQDLLMKQGSHIIPTEPGMTLYKTLLSATPLLVDPAETARMEIILDEVMGGHKTPAQAIQEIADRAGKLIPIIQKAGQSITITQQRVAVSSAQKAGRGGPTGASRPQRTFSKGSSRPSRPGSNGSAPRAGAGAGAGATSRGPSSASAAASARAFNVAYADKDRAKALGLRWNPDAKHWYAPSDDIAREAAKQFKAL